MAELMEKRLKKSHSDSIIKNGKKDNIGWYCTNGKIRIGTHYSLLLFT